MRSLINHKEFRNDHPDRKRQQQLALFFFPFTIIVLWIDSVYFARNFFDGNVLTNVAVVIYFILMFRTAGSALRVLMFIMVFWSFVGELIFCELLGWYDYRIGTIPVYVPFGHAIVYASGYVISESMLVKKHTKRVQKLFAVSFILLFALTGYFLNDPFTIATGLLFFALLKRKRWQNLYFCIAACVIFIELTGTFWQCWTWKPNISGYIPTTNPPMGIVFFYAAGDVFLAKFAAMWERQALKNRTQA